MCEEQKNMFWYETIDQNRLKIKSARLPPTAPSTPPATHPHNKPLSYASKNNLIN
jgi:hypothetical protein